MSFRSFASLFLLGPWVLGAPACSKDKDRPEAPQLGEPVGAEVQAKGNVPAFSLALAVSRGRDPVSLLPQLVGAVSGAVTSCPAFVAEEKESVTALNFTVTGGKMKVTPRLDPSAGVKCLVSTLDGKDVSGGDRMLPPSRVVGAEPHDVGPLNATSSLDGRLEIKIKMSTGAAKTP